MHLIDQDPGRSLQPQRGREVGIDRLQAAPSQGRCRPSPPPSTERIRALTRFTGIAKPIPIEPPLRVKIAVLIPTSAPSRVTRAPPELPGLIAASVWMNDRSEPPSGVLRATAETMPLVTVWPMPNGLPIASTRSPTSSRSESPSGSVGSAVGLDVQEREVGGLVGADQLGPELAPIGQHHHDLVGILDHVVIGDDQTVGVAR